MYGLSLGMRLTGFFAVATLPIGILAAMFLGLQPAVAVFLIGWFLLTPGSALLFGTTPGMSNEMDELIQEEMKRSIQEQRESSHDDGIDTSTDPVEKLRQRYASGEIDDHEFEQKLEAILEMEDINPEDKKSIERTLESLDDGSMVGHEGVETARQTTSDNASDSHEKSREPEYE
jgi:hypothetical protein